MLPPRPPWPYSPSSDLPQLITTLLVDDDERIEGVWWSETFGYMQFSFGGADLSLDQLEHITTWLENWLVTEPHRFTDKGRACIERMCADLRCHIARAEEERGWQRQWETSEFDHLL